MPISKEQLAKIISSKAGGLCSPEADKRFDAMAGRSSINEAYNNPDPSDYEDYGDDPWGMPGQMGGNNGEFAPHPVNQKTEYAYSQQTASNSRIPDAIKQSMLENRIDTSSLSNVSVLDQLGVKAPAQKPQQRQQVIEQRVQQPAQSSAIDYALIKSIVKECLAESQSQMLNESALKQIHLAGGKINIVDNSGNIYSAKLEKTGNIKDKKK